MFTGRDARDEAASTATGLDINLPFIVRGQNLVFIAGTSWTHDSTGGAPNYSRFVVDFPNDFADIVSRVERVEAGFNPSLGFVRADDIVRYGGSFRITPRPNIPHVRQLEFNLLNYQYVQRLGGGMDNAQFSVTPLGVRFNSGDEVQLNLSREGDAPLEAFDVFEGTVVAPGNYWYDRWEIEYDGSSSRPVRLELSASFGKFYHGGGEDYSIGVEGRWQPHLLWSLDFGYTAGRFPTSQFIARTTTARVDYALTPRLNTTLFAQWNNEANRGAVNARMRWTRTPGSDLYVVLNSAWPTGLEGRSIPWSRPSRGGVVVKYVQYLRY
jgi:hypothetical protein